jgi:glucan-binding YG repeat protein
MSEEFIPLDQIPEGAAGGLWDAELEVWAGEWYYTDRELQAAADGVARSGGRYCVLDSDGEVVEHSGN